MIEKEKTWLFKYREAIKNGEIQAGQELIMQLDNLIKDLENPRYIYDTSEAYRRIDFIENCIRLTKSPFYGKPMKLMLFQKAFIEVIYSFKMAATGFDRFKKVILLIGRKNGKALALNTPIPTPNGVKTIEEIKVGDYVFSELGKPVKVIAESEIFKNRVCYKITFEDGEEIIADENHKWAVQTKSIRNLKRYKPTSNRKRYSFQEIDKYGCKVLTTKDMVNDYKRIRMDKKGTYYKYRVPMSKAVHYGKKELFSPYVLGLWLGDGDKGDNRLSVGKDDLETLLNELKKENINVHSVKKYRGKYEVRIGEKIGYHRHDIREKLREIGVWENKHIPEEYLTASVEQRTALLQGLMDTDGCCSKAGQCQFVQKSEKVAIGISKLLVSLGIKHNVKEKIAKCNGKKCGYVYHINFFVDKTNPCFRYERKKNRLKDTLSNRMNYKSIIDIKRVENQDTKCITVNSERGLFLCGEKNTVTHNSELCSALMLTEMIMGNSGSDIVASSNDDTQANILYDAVDVMRKMIDPDQKDTWRNQMHIRNKLTNSKIFKLSDKTRNKEGRNIDLAVIDEVHEQKEPVILKSIEQSQSLKDNPKLLIISTEGFVNDGTLDQLLVDCRRIINGEEDGIAAERTLPWLYTQDSEQEIWRDESSWQKSNPTLGIVKKWDYLREQIDLASRNKADRVFVLSKDFNIKQSNSQAWLLSEDYKYEAKFNIEDFKDSVVLGAVDLAETTDLTCAKILLMKPNDNTKYVYTQYFIPESKLENSPDFSSGASYLEWAKNGYLKICEGNENDLSVVADWFYEIYKKYNIKLLKCGYDQRFAKDFLNRMDYYGFECEMVYQNKQTLSNPMKLLEADLKSQSINYNENPIDQWCFGNASVEVDNFGQCMAVKINNQAAKRIDGAVTTIILYEMYRRYRSEFNQYVNR